MRRAEGQTFLFSLKTKLQMNGFSVLTISDRADMSVIFVGCGFWDERHSEFLNVGRVVSQQCISLS